MAEHLTQDVDPRLAQSVVDSTTGADGVTTLSNAQGVEVAAVVPGEEANSNNSAVSSNGVVIEGNSINDSSIKNKRDDSPAGASGTESTKSTDKPTAQKAAASRKPPAIKSMSLNKAFLSGNASAAPTQPSNGKLTLSVDKGSKGIASGAAAASASAAKPRLVSKIGPSGSRIGGIGQLGGKAGTIPSVWNRNQPPAPVPAKEYTDEELSKVGIHMAERLHTEDSKEAKWADIDDEDENWVPPDTIEWNDGTKVTLDAEIPKPTISAFEKQIGTQALKEQRASHASHTSPNMTSASPSLPPKPLDHHAPRKPDFIPSMPPSKIPWAAVPSGQFPTPRPVAPPFQQYPGRPPPPNHRPMMINTHSPKEVAVDDFNRQSWRDRQSSQSPSTLFNSETGNFDPVGEANRNRDQARRNSRNEGPGVRPTSLLQRPGGKEHEHEMSFHHHTRFQPHDHFPAPGTGPMDMGRRRSGSIRSAGLSDASSTAWDNRHPPNAGNAVTVSGGGGAVDNTLQRPNQNSLYVGPGGDPRLNRHGPQNPPTALPPLPDAATVEVVPEPGENLVEAQKRVMKDAREQARARRLAEEAAAEEEKKLRIQKKLAELDERMKADAASKAEKSKDTEVLAGESSVDVGSQSEEVVPPSSEEQQQQQPPVKSDEAPSIGGQAQSPEHGRSDAGTPLNGNDLNGFKPQPTPQATGSSQTTTVTTHSVSPIQQHNNTAVAHPPHNLYGSPPHHPSSSSSSSHNPPLPPSSIPPTSPSLPFSFQQPSNSFQSTSHHQHQHQYQASPNGNFSQTSPSFNSNSHFHRYVEHPHPHSVTANSQYPPVNSSSSSSHPHPPRSYDNRNHHRPPSEQGNFHHPSTSRFATHPPPPHQQPSNGSNQTPYPPVPHSSSSHPSHPEFHEEEMPQPNAPMTGVYSTMKVGNNAPSPNVSLPTSNQEKQFPVEIPKDWKRNGVMKPSPWTPTAAETHVKRFPMFLPTNKDGQQPQQASPKATWGPNETKQDASLANAGQVPEASEKVVQDTEGNPAEAMTVKLPEDKQETSPPPTAKNEVDLQALVASVPNLYTIARSRRGDEFVPGTRTTYKQLMWAANMNQASKGGDPRLDKGFDAFYAKEAKNLPKEEKPMTFSFGGVEDTPATAPALSSGAVQAKKSSDDERFDRVKSAIMGAAGGSWRENSLQEVDAAPRWREPARTPNEHRNWATWGKGAWGERRDRLHQEYQESLAAWEKRQQAKGPAVRVLPPVDTLPTLDTLQVTSKPPFQGAVEGKPKVSLPRVAAPPPSAVTVKPELPNTLPTEEEFKEMAFQQEFGSTPTVCLPTMTRAFPGDATHPAPTTPKRGKDRFRLREQDIRSRLVFEPDMVHTTLPTTIRVKLPGTSEAKALPMPASYEAKIKAQHRNRGHYGGEPRSNSGNQTERSSSATSRPRGPNQHGGRRNQTYSGPNRTNA